MNRRRKNIYKISWELTKSRGREFVLLLFLITFFKTEVPLVVPGIIRWVYAAVESGDAVSLFLAAGKGMCIFLLNVLLMYGINVYGDSWAVKLSFCAAENGYKRVSAMPVGNVKNRFSGGDIFNRIVAGTGHIVGLWFSTIDVISGLAATGILLYLFAGQSFWIMATVGVLVFFDAVRCIVMYFFVSRATVRLEKKRTACINYLRSVVSSHTFHVMNGTEEFILSKYREAREIYMAEELRKSKFCAVFDSMAEIFHSIFLLLFGEYMDLRRKGAISMAEVNASYNRYTSLDETVNTLVRVLTGFSGRVVPVARLEELLACDRGGRCRGNILELQNFSLSLNGKEILKNIDLKIEEGEKVAVIGDNGSGKTTLLKSLAGLFCEEMEENGSRDRMSYLPSDIELFESQTVRTNLLMSGVKNDKIMWPDSFLNRSCRVLSGGEKQRVGLLRSAAAGREILLWDEPASALDEGSGNRCVKREG